MSSSPQRPAKSDAAEKKYKGVRLRKWGRWVSEIRLPNSRERVWLGSYDTPEKAARAFDAAFVCLRGPGAAGAGINFPDSPPSLRCRSCDPQVVQAAALSHANRDSSATVHEAAVEALMDVDSNTKATAALAPEQGAAVRDEDVDDDAVAPAPAPVLADGSIDWSWSPMAMMANPPPLFSPTGFGSNAYGCFYMPPPTVSDAADDDVEESTDLWNFHTGDSNFWIM